ncbi:MAG: GFA family protein [Pseudomonadota bacterium]
MASGHCLCGAVSYTCANPDAVMLCYCKDCQRASGSTHMPIFMTPAAGFKLSGETKFHAVKGDEAGLTVERHFCAACGGQLFSKLAEMPDLVIVKAGTVDDMPDVPVAAALWTRSAPAYAALPEGVPAFPGNAPMGG